MQHVDPSQLPKIEPLSENDQKDVLHVFAQSVNSGLYSLTDAFKYAAQFGLDVPSLAVKAVEMGVDHEDAFAAAFALGLKEVTPAPATDNPAIKWAHLSLAIPQKIDGKKDIYVADLPIEGTDDDKPEMLKSQLSESEWASMRRKNAHAIYNAGNVSFAYAGMDKRLYPASGHGMIISLTTLNDHTLTWTVDIDSPLDVATAPETFLPALRETAPKLSETLHKMATEGDATGELHGKLMTLMAQREETNFIDAALPEQEAAILTDTTVMPKVVEADAESFFGRLLGRMFSHRADVRRQLKAEDDGERHHHAEQEVVTFSRRTGSWAPRRGFSLNPFKS